MSTRWYNILFRFEVLHNFYASGLSLDINIQPTAATKQKLAGSRHLLRQKDNSPLILFEAIDDQRSPLIAFTGDVKLVFTGRLANPYFSNFTQLPAKEAEQVYVYDNLSGNALQQTPAYIRPQVFAFAFTTTRVNATLEIADRDGTVILNKTVHNSDKVFSENLKLLGVEGLHRFTVTTTQGVEVDQQIYISNDFSTNKPWCIIEIFQKGAVQFNYAVETAYQLQFTAQAKPWQFNLLLRQGYQNATFTIEDKENYGSPKDHPYSKIDFVETSGNQTYEAGQTVKFITGTAVNNPQAVPFFEVSKKDLQLTISKNGSDTIIRPLPVPPSISSLQEVYINI